MNEKQEILLLKECLSLINQTVNTKYSGILANKSYNLAVLIEKYLELKDNEESL